MAKNSQKTKPLSVQIADTVKLQACRVIDKMDKAYQPIAAKLEGLATGIFELCLVAAKLGKGVPEYTQAYFKEMCKSAEAHYKEAQGIDNVKDRLPCWAVFKSEINRAIDSGLNPANFDSYTAFREARKAQDRAEQEKALEKQTQGRESAAMRDGVREGSGTEGLSAAATSNKVTTKLAATLTVLQGAIGGMDEETQDAFAEELAEIVAKYAPKMQKETRKPAKARHTKPEAESVPAGQESAAQVA
jgi:hypothetical protein